ncbi:MAG: ECF transporter S component [Muribaculaceae bacterium]|nr:ECF transporter S component [Muribaculaceae bacterium]
MQTTSQLYSLKYNDIRTYITATLFIAGNIILPQLFHLIPQGGVTWLPIYFFTLIGAYKYGWRMGLITAIASPLVNSWLFGMPAPAVLPAILLKSILLAMLAGIAASKYEKASLKLLIAVVAGYQTAGTIGEWILTNDLRLALQDLRIGLPGMALQVFGGWCAINLMLKR